MPFNGPWGEGEGSMKEFFSGAPSAWTEEAKALYSKEALAALEESAKMTADRDFAIDRLVLQLFTEFSGVSPDAHVRAFWIDYDYMPYDPERTEAEYEVFEAKARKKFKRDLRNAKRRKGLVIVGIQPDDPIIGLFCNGEPIAGFYASYRGVYQAGAYSTGVLEGSTAFGSFFASDFAAEPHNEWMPAESICADIARDFVLGRRLY